MIQTSSNLFNVNLILQPLHYIIQQLSHMKLSDLLLEVKFVLIYWMMNILQCLMSLIQSQIYQPFINFQHILRNICKSFLSVDKSLPRLKARLMNSIFVKIKMESPNSRSVYAEGRAIRGKILKRIFQILSSQTCGFTSWILTPRETYHPKYDCFIFKGSAETILERRFICAICGAFHNNLPWFSVSGFAGN